MPMYDLIEYNDNYSKTSEILWQYCRDEPDLVDDDAIANLTEANSITNLLKTKEKIIGKTDNDGKKMLKQWYH